MLPFIRLGRRIAFVACLIAAAGQSAQAAYEYTFTAYGNQTLQFITANIIPPNTNPLPPATFTQGSADLSSPYSFSQAQSIQFGDVTLQSGNGNFTYLAFNFPGSLPQSAGTYLTTPTGVVSAGNAGSPGSLTISYIPSTPPSISKGFGLSTVPLGTDVRLTFDLFNPNTLDLHGVAFADPLPSGLIVDSTPLNSCGGAVSAPLGSQQIQLSNGIIPAGVSCNISVYVTGTGLGPQNNTTGTITSIEAGTGNTASASVNVLTPLSIVKLFNTASISLNGITGLKIFVTNVNTIALTGVSFTDNFPAGLAVASPNGLFSDCGPASVGPNSASVTGGIIGAGSTCEVDVNVTGTALGAKNNGVSGASANGTNPGQPAGATLYVAGPPQLSKAFGSPNLAVNGTTSLTFTIVNPNSIQLTGVGFTDPLPSNVKLANTTLTNTCTGTTATATSLSKIMFSGTLAANASCTVTATVTGVQPGSEVNTSSAITSNEGGNGPAASAPITVFEVPTLAKQFGAPSITLNATTSLAFHISNANTEPLTGVNFTDPLPSGLQLANPTLTDTCAGTTAVATSASLITFSGSLGANANCTVTATVIGIGAGPQSNTTSAITSNEGGNGTPAMANITVIAPLSISKSFAPVSITPGGQSTLTFQISNPNSSTQNGVAFTDNLPTGLLVALPNNFTSNCNGNATAAGSTITLAKGSVSASSSCTIAVSVTAAKEGTYNNVTGPVSSTQGGTGNTGQATLTVAQPPTLAKTFSALAIPQGDTATLTFTLTNPNQVVSLTGVAFTDTLPSGLIVSTPNGLSTTCSGTISAPAGSTTITANGVALSAPAGSCVVTVSVTAIASGVQVNTTSPITSVQTVAGAPATATITTGDVFEVNYAANLGSGDAQIDITNTGFNGASLDGPGFGTPAGNICVNVYALSPDEQLISCCSCLVTPDALVSLSVDNDITANTATGAHPGSLVIKLVSTLAGGTGGGTSCTNSAATPAPLTPGLEAWRTSLHAAPSGGYTPTETPFTQSTLSAQELASLAGRCTSILGNNSGSGICNSCRSGGLGAARQ